MVVQATLRFSNGRRIGNEELLQSSIPAALQFAVTLDEKQHRHIISVACPLESSIRTKDQESRGDHVRHGRIPCHDGHAAPRRYRLPRAGVEYVTDRTFCSLHRTLRL
jgi:hypothetical protein